MERSEKRKTPRMMSKPPFLLMSALSRACWAYTHALPPPGAALELAATLRTLCKLFVALCFSSVRLCHVHSSLTDPLGYSASLELWTGI